MDRNRTDGDSIDPLDRLERAYAPEASSPRVQSELDAAVDRVHQDQTDARADFGAVLAAFHDTASSVAVVVGLLAGYLTAPGAPDELDSFASSTMLLTNPRSTGPLNLDQAALLATTGDV